MLRYYIIVSGLVQEVGFRYFVVQTAILLNLKGCVKNSLDGTVHMEVQGEEPTVSKFIEKIKKGNRFSRVDSIQLQEIPLKSDEKSFRIAY